MNSIPPSFWLKLKSGYSKIIHSQKLRSVLTITNAIIVILIGISGTVIVVQQYKLDNFKSEIIPSIENYTFITNDPYLKYPLSEKISFTSVSPHYLKAEISDIHFTTVGIPRYNKTLPSKIDFGEPIVKYIDRGVTNQQFEIPFLLTFNAKNLPYYDNDTTLVTFFTSTRIKVIDIQDNDKVMYDQNLTGGISIPGKYVPKQYHETVRDDMQ